VQQTITMRAVFVLHQGTVRQPHQPGRGWRWCCWRTCNECASTDER